MFFRSPTKGFQGRCLVMSLELHFVVPLIAFSSVSNMPDVKSLLLVMTAASIVDEKGGYRRWIVKLLFLYL